MGVSHFTITRVTINIFNVIQMEKGKSQHREIFAHSTLVVWFVGQYKIRIKLYCFCLQKMQIIQVLTIIWLSLQDIYKSKKDALMGSGGSLFILSYFQSPKDPLQEIRDIYDLWLIPSNHDGQWLFSFKSYLRKEKDLQWSVGHFKNLINCYYCFSNKNVMAC